LQDTESIYAPPQANLEAADAAASGARGRLYSPRAVAVATFLGSLLAGGSLMALNFRRLGRGRAALWALLGAVLAQAALFALAFALPASVHVPSVAYTAVQVLVMLYAAKRLQGADIDSHVNAGGRLASGWTAAGIGLLYGMVMMAGLLVALDRFGA